MTNNSALRQLELAEARKQTADEAEKAKQKSKPNKKSILKWTNDKTMKQQSTSATPNQDNNAVNMVDITAEQVETDATRKHKVFYTMKLVTKGGIDPIKVLQQMLRDWFRTMQSCVGSLVIYDT